MGIRTMICLTLTKNLSLANAEKVMAIAVQQAKLKKALYINLLFLVNSAPDVFKYREIFTKYVDVGVRVYVEGNIEKFKRILSENCRELYVSHSDEEMLKILRGLGGNLKIQET